MPRLDADLEDDIHLGCIYTATSYLSSYADYDSPPVIDCRLKHPLPSNAVCVHSRLATIGPQTYKIWSPNSRQNPFLPTSVDPIYEKDFTLPPLSDRRWDGQLGPGDPTISPQHYNGLERFLPFIPREPSQLSVDPWDTDHLDPEIEFVPIYEAWQTLPDSYKGRIAPEYLDRLQHRHDMLDRMIVDQQKQPYACRDLGPIFHTSQQDFRTLHGITAYADAVILVRKLQRFLLKKRAWLNMQAIGWDSGCSLDSMRKSTIPLANDSIMGLWINGADIPERDLLWFLTVARVPCFIIEEYGGPPQCDTLNSFIARTPIERLIQRCRYDELARTAGGTVIVRSGSVIDATALSPSKTTGALVSPPPDDHILFRYPPTVGGVSVRLSDLCRISDPEAFLNDTLIELGLKMWSIEIEEKNPALAKQLFVFSTFFFKKLDQKDGYTQVERWTSKVDIFTKKYLMIPVNQNKHWYLCLIYNPQYILPAPKSNKTNEIEDLPELTEYTYVFSLDSLSRSHSRELQVLIQYLIAEAVRKRGVARDATRNPLTIKANVPNQVNGFDCGIHVLYLARKFLSDPEIHAQHIQGDNSAARWGRPDKLREDLSSRMKYLAAKHMHAAEKAKEPAPQVSSASGDAEVELVDKVELVDEVALVDKVEPVDKVELVDEVELVDDIKLVHAPQTCTAGVQHGPTDVADAAGIPSKTENLVLTSGGMCVQDTDDASGAIPYAVAPPLPSSVGAQPAGDAEMAPDDDDDAVSLGDPLDEEEGMPSGEQIEEVVPSLVSGPLITLSVAAPSRPLPVPEQHYSEQLNEERCEGGQKRRREERDCREHLANTDRNPSKRLRLTNGHDNNALKVISGDPLVPAAPRSPGNTTIQLELPLAGLADLNLNDPTVAKLVTETLFRAPGGRNFLAKLAKPSYASSATHSEPWEPSKTQGATGSDTSVDFEFHPPIATTSLLERLSSHSFVDSQPQQYRGVRAGQGSRDRRKAKRAARFGGQKSSS